MARARYPKSSGPPPPPLSPLTRTVGQLIAETLHLYGRHFFKALPLGLVVALADQVSLGLDTSGQIVVFVVAAPLFSAAYVAACVIVSARTPTRGAALSAFVIGTIIFLPAAFLLPWFQIAAAFVLAFFGNAVPAIVIDGCAPRASLRRSITVARADLVHAVGGLAALAIMFGITRTAMQILLREQADNTVRAAVFLADVVLAPMLFLGAALLYTDLAARIGTTRAERLTARDAEFRAAK